jgi:hemerythrin-like domain-containing protein
LVCSIIHTFLNYFARAINNLAHIRKEDNSLCSYVRRRLLHGQHKKRTREEDLRKPKPQKKKEREEKRKKKKLARLERQQSR